MEFLNINVDALLKNCKIASIAHAVMAGFYPELNYEHSWDGLNYNLVNENGIRGTITFYKNNCVGAFRNENSFRYQGNLNYLSYFVGASKKIIDLAEKETLQYLLIDTESGTVPAITTSFWNCKKNIVSFDSKSEFLLHGGEIISNYFLPIKETIEKWKEYYEMNSKQVELLSIIYKKMEESKNNRIFLNLKEILMIGEINTFDIDEVKNSFAELNIFLKV